MIRKFFVLFGTLAIIVFFAAVIVLMGKMRPDPRAKASGGHQPRGVCDSGSNIKISASARMPKAK